MKKRESERVRGGEGYAVPPGDPTEVDVAPCRVCALVMEADAIWGVSWARCISDETTDHQPGTSERR